MKSEYPDPRVSYPAEELQAPPSRLLDEKISDDPGRRRRWIARSLRLG